MGERSEGRFDAGYDPSCRKWEVLTVGSIYVEHGEDDIQIVRYPGWHLRSTGGVEVRSSNGSYASGPSMASKLRIGGYTVPELQALSEARNERELAELYAAAREAISALDQAAEIIRREFGVRDPLAPWVEAEAARNRLDRAVHALLEAQDD